MPRNLRRLSDHFNTQTPDNETSNKPQSPWFPFIYGSQAHQDQNSCGNVDSGQGSVSTDISHNSSLQSKNGVHKRKGDDVVYNSTENHPHNTRNVKSHIQIPASQPISPNNPFASVKFPIASEIDRHHNSFGNTDSDQPLVSSNISLNSSLQSKYAGQKIKGDGVMHDCTENHPHNTRIVESHIRIPTSQSLLANNASASMKFPIVSEFDEHQNSCGDTDSGQGSVSNDTSQNSMLQSKNAGHKRKSNAVLHNSMENYPHNTWNAKSHIQIATSQPILSTNGSASMKFPVVTQEIDRYQNSSANLDSGKASISSSTSQNSSLQSTNGGRTRKIPDLTDNNTTHYPNPPSDVSHQQQIYEDRFPKRLRQQSRQTVTSQKRTGGATYNVRNRLRANNLLKTFASSPTPVVEQPSLLPNADTTSSYEDLGDCDQRCEHCGAAFWYEERVKRSSTNTRTEYHLCCSQGRFIMDHEADPPQYIKQLFSNRDFMDNIRAYNQMFAMTSFGANIDKSINDGRGPYVFRISGQIYHWIGSLCPVADNDTPRFLQLYIYDTKNEVQNRMSHFEPSEQPALDPKIVQGLIDFFDAHNELVQILRTARDLCSETDIPEFKLKLYNAGRVRNYELPTSNTLAAIVFDNGLESESNYDVIIQYKGGQPQRINKLHQSYMSLQFPLIFIYGQPGFHTQLTLKSANPTQRPRRVSLNAYYTHQLHPRPHLYDLLFRTGRLFQQYVVGVYCCIEQSRMDFYRKHQSDIRCDYLSGLYDAVSRGDSDGSQAGSRIILPSSFTGGPRYMYSHYLDALAICRELGNPQFFITFTCNINWPEIQRYMAEYPLLTTSDRADVVCRVFEQKIKAFINFLKNKRPFGYVTGVLYTVEFQKRGLPHCHTLVWLRSTDKIQDAQDIDRYISAELPDPVLDPQGYKTVSEMMIHGPCGAANLNAPCMEGTNCTKNFPKKYNNQTFFDSYGHVHYQRRQTQVSTIKKQMKLDNTYVVPYNRALCLAFEAHINVEYCGWSMLIKYLFKYISKGTDRIFAKVTRSIGDTSTSSKDQHSQIDEIQNFQDGRFICPHEAMWRILNFKIHAREPAVQILSVHLENMQHITFRDNDNLESVVNHRDRKVTTLTEWFAYNANNEDGRHLTYLQFSFIIRLVSRQEILAAEKKHTIIYWPTDICASKFR